MTIGQRASKAINERAKQNGTCVYQECAILGVSRKLKTDWNRRGLNPSPLLLQRFALEGYDVHYILTGVKK